MDSETPLAPLHAFDSKQLVARIVPDLPKGTPRNIALPQLERIGARRFFSADHGFVPVEPGAVQLLKSIHCDGETTVRGGRGPKLFEVCTAQEAADIIAEEQRRALLSRAGGAVMHAELRAVVDAQGADRDARLEGRLGDHEAKLIASEAENAELRDRLARLEAAFLNGAAPAAAALVATVNPATGAVTVVDGSTPISNNLAAEIRAQEAAAEGRAPAPVAAPPVTPIAPVVAAPVAVAQAPAAAKTPAKNRVSGRKKPA